MQILDELEGLISRNLTQQNDLYQSKEILNKFKQNRGELKELLETFKNYEALLETIKSNAIYFILHLDTINSWLLSDDFRQNFHSKSHPYPSLINPLEANYETLGADLAWSLNLPLNYTPKLVWMAIQSSGTMLNILATELITKQAIYSANGILGTWNANGFWDSTNRLYKYCLEHKPELITVGFRNFKFFNLLKPDTNVAYAVRDPLSLFKTATNHIDNQNLVGGRQEFELDMDLLKRDDIFAKVSYYGGKDSPNMDRIELYRDKGWFGFCFDFYKSVSNLKSIGISPICIEFDQLSPKNAFDTYLNVAKACKLDIPDKEALKNLLSFKINRFEGDLISLPVKLYACRERGKEVSITITTHALHPNKTNFEDITQKVFGKRKLIFENVILLVEKQEIAHLHDTLLNSVRLWLNKYMDLLEENEKKIKEKLYSEAQILEYFKEHKDTALKLKQSLDRCYEHVKQDYPQYVEKWKYYKEFEELCSRF